MVDIKKMEKMLMEMGHPDNLLGTEYLRHAIPAYTRGMSITKELYPGIARAVGTTPQRVERAIRHSIEVAWSRNDYEVQLRYFGGSIDPQRGKPTNGEYIARLERLCRED